jgi:hypothetical protein
LTGSDIDFGFNRDTKLKDLRKNELYSHKEASLNLFTQKKLISEQLKKKGDPELTNTEVTANGFHKVLVDDFNMITKENKPNRIEDIVSCFGISALELNECKTIGDVCDFAVFKKQFPIFSDGADNYRLDSSQIKPRDIPSWYITNTMADVCRKGKERADGGDIVDCGLAALSLYCDHLVVDKRTLYFLEQVSKMQLFKGLVNNFFKLPIHVELGNKIKQINQNI